MKKDECIIWNEHFLKCPHCQKWFKEQLKIILNQVSQEISQYSGINDIQTKDLLKLLKNIEK